MTDPPREAHAVTGIRPGDLVWAYDDAFFERIYAAEDDPMLVLEVGRVCDLTMMPSKLSADWSAARVLRSDGIRRAYPIDVLTPCEKEGEKK